MTIGEAQELKSINDQIDNDQDAAKVSKAVSLLTSESNTTPQTPQTIAALVAVDPEAERQRIIQDGERQVLKNILLHSYNSL